MEEDSLGQILSFIHRNVRALLDEELAHMDIGFGPRRYLVEITLHEGLSQEELSRHLLMDKTTTARAVKRLEDCGYLERRRDTHDRRHYRLYPTDRARTFLPDIVAARRRLREGLTSGFSEEEKKELFSLLKKVADNAVRLREEKQKRSGLKAPGPV